MRNAQLRGFTHDNSEGGCLAWGRILLSKIHREVLARPAVPWVLAHTHWRQSNFEKKQTVTEFWSVVYHALEDWMWRQECFVMVEFEMWYHSLALKKIFSDSTLKSWNVGVPEVCCGKVSLSPNRLNVCEERFLYLVLLVMALCRLIIGSHCFIFNETQHPPSSYLQNIGTVYSFKCWYLCTKVVLTL